MRQTLRPKWGHDVTKVTFRKFTFLAASMLVGAQLTTAAKAQSIPTSPPPFSPQTQMMAPAPPIAPMVSQAKSVGQSTTIVRKWH